ncbi:MAG: SRPBCC family protein [Flavobacteriaceae bacterium]|nr:SRPBCC family protein [Flavobacteriaceae bacterium]
MNLEGRKVVVNKSTKELFEMLKKPQDYQHLMPESLVSFEHNDDGFKFGLKGMPEIALKIQEIVENEKVVLASANPSLDFSLTGLMKSISENQSEVQLVFNGNFNPFVKMMVEKPLQNFIGNLTEKIEQL